MKDIAGTRPDILEELLRDPPLLHRQSNQPVSWAISRGLMHELGRTVKAGQRTLETGAGVSTIIFAARGANHTSVVPDRELTIRISNFCAERAIDTSVLRFLIGPSEDILPGASLSELDLVLIDGRHGFPAPFIDWYYTASHLRVGGTLIVDDTNLWTGEILRDFLCSDDTWRLVRELDGKTAIFEKLADGSHKAEWVFQPFTVNMSRKERERIGAMRRYRVRRALELVRHGQLIELVRKVLANLRR